MIEDADLIENESDDSSDPLELISGLTFHNWKEFKSWIYRFALEKGSNYKSETDQGVLRCATYEYFKSGSNVSQGTSDPSKRHNTHSQRTQCPWKLNVTYPKSSGVVKINSFCDEHNYPLTSMPHDFEN